jgi:methionyl-tRNA synthetase
VLPENVPANEFLNFEGQKFSKSRGWYVGLREFLNAFPADYLRYYLAAITPYSQSDVNFDWKEFQGDSA